MPFPNEVSEAPSASVPCSSYPAVRTSRHAACHLRAQGESNRRESLFIALLTILIGLGSALYFFLVLAHGIETDLQPHIQMTELSLKYHSWPPNFLYYWAIALCAGFSSELPRLEGAVIFVLGVSCALRFLVSVWVGRQLLSESATWSERRDLRYGFYIAIALLQVAHNVIDLYQNSPYLGYFPPNVWHNSTMIFLMPWAILLFYFAYRAITRGSARDLWLLAIFGLINVAIKTSLVLVLGVVVPLAAVFLHRFSLKTVKIGLALVPPAAFMALQAILIYSHRFAGSILARYHEQMGTTGESRVAFEFLALWPPHTLSTIICSFLYPITAIVVLRMRLLRDSLFAFAAACLGVGMLQFMCLVETGYRRIHGNFTWQVLICAYTFFFSVIVIQFRQLLRQERAEERDMIPGVAFAIHVLCGLAYFGIIFATGNFRGD